MSIERKRGALSTKEMEFIGANCTKIPIKEIADKLNRNEEPIAKYIHKMNLATVENVEGDDQRMLLRNRLQHRYYWSSIKAQLISNKEVNEHEIFINKWIDMMIQFQEDVLPLEEEQMKELILLSIQMDRIRFQEAKNLRRIAELEEFLRIEYGKPEPIQGGIQPPTAKDIGKIETSETELSLARATSESCSNQIKNINHDSSVLFKDLKGTREQRFKRVESGEKTFAALIRKLQDDTKREQLEREIEIMRIATEKKREKLYDFHTYSDGAVDRPILNSDSVKYIGETPVESDAKNEEMV